MVDIGRIEGALALRDEFTNPIGKMQQTLSGLVRQFAPAVAGLASIAGVINTIKKSVDAAANAESVVTRLNTAIIATGGAAGKTTEELRTMAREYSKAFGIEDEAIMESQTVLLRFGKVQNEVFDRATKDMIDMSQQMGTGLSSAATMLGRALESPTNGMLLLRRAGVVFSSEQQEVIKTLAETGRLSEAQGKILDALEGKFKGAAAAVRNTFSGSLAAAKVEIGELMEALGQTLIPVIQKVTEWIATNGESFTEMAKTVGTAVVNSMWVFISAIKILLTLKLIDWLKSSAEQAMVFASKMANAGKVSLASSGMIGLIVSVLFLANDAIKAYGDRCVSEMARIKTSMEDFGRQADVIKDVAKRIRDAANGIVEITPEEAEAIKARIQTLENEIKGLESSSKAAAAELNRFFDQQQIPADQRTKDTLPLQYVYMLADADKKVATNQALANAKASEATSLYGQLAHVTIKTATVTDELGESIKDFLKNAEEQLKALKRQAQATTMLIAVNAKHYKSEYDRAKAIKATERDVFKLTHSAAIGLSQDMLKSKAIQDMVAQLDKQTMANYDLEQSLKDVIDAEGALNEFYKQRQQKSKELFDSIVADQEARLDAAIAAGKSVEAMEEELQAQIDYAAAVKKGTAAVIEFQAAQMRIQFIKDNGGIFNVDPLALSLFDDYLEKWKTNTKEIAAETAKWTDMMKAVDIIGSFDGKMGSIAGKFVSIAASIKVIKSEAGQTAKSFEGWATAISSGVALLTEAGIIAGPGGGTSQFGGKMSGTYAAEGAAVGAVVGAILAAVFTWGVGTAGGAAIGAAVGQVFGSIIKKGADEGLMSLRDDAGNLSVQLAGSVNKLQLALKNAGKVVIDSVMEIVTVLGGELKGVADISFKIRNDIIKVWVNGLARQFKDMGEAISFAVTELLKTADISGIDEMFKSALKGTNADNLDQLKTDLEAIQQILGFEMTDSQRAISGFSTELDRLRMIAMRTITDTQQLGRALSILAEEEGRRWRSSRDAITGDKMSNAEKLKLLQADAAMWNAEKNLRLAELQSKAAAMTAQKAALMASLALYNAGVRLDDARLQALKAYLDGLGTLLSAEITMQGSFLEVSFATLQIQIDAMNQLIGVLNSLPDIDIGSLRLPNTGGGGHTGGGITGPSEAEQRLIDFNEFLRQQGLAGLTQYQQALAQLNAEFAAQAAAAAEVAGGEEALAEARRAALQRLREEVIDRLNLPLESVRDRMQELVDQQADLRWSSGLLQQQFENGEITAEEWAAALERLHGIQGELRDAARLDLANMAVALTEAMGMDEESIALRKQIADMEWALKVAEFRLSLETYHNLGRISDELYKTYLDILGKAEDWVPSEHWDPGNIDNSQSNNSNNGNPLLDALKSALERLRSAVENLRKSNEDLLLSDASPLTMRDQFLEAQRRYNETLAAARGGDITAIENFAGVREQYLALAAAMFGTSGAGYQSIFQQSLQAGQDLAAAGQAILDAIPPQMQGTEIRLDNIADILRLMASQMGVHPGWDPGPHGNAGSGMTNVIGRMGNVSYGNFGSRGSGDQSVLAQLQAVNDNLVTIAQHQAQVAIEARNDRMTKPTLSHAGIITKRGA